MTYGAYRLAGHVVFEETAVGLHLGSHSSDSNVAPLDLAYGQNELLSLAYRFTIVSCRGRSAPIYCGIFPRGVCGVQREKFFPHQSPSDLPPTSVVAMKEQRDVNGPQPLESAPGGASCDEGRDPQ